MRAKKVKRVRRILDACAQTVGLADPIPVLIDSSFAKMALRHRVNMSDQLHRLLDGWNLALCTTRCVLKECQLLGPIMAGTFKVLSCLELHPCHHKRPTTAVRCLARALLPALAPPSHAVASSDGAPVAPPSDPTWRPLLASNSKPLRSVAHRLTGLPCLLLEHGQPLLTGLPAGTRRLLADRRLRGLRAEAHDAAEAAAAATSADTLKQKRRKRQRGANPLSCLPAKKRPAAAKLDGGHPQVVNGDCIRRRRRGCRAGWRRRPWHVRQFCIDALLAARAAHGNLPPGLA